MEIETVGELLYACKENRLKLFKGFGEKTQQNVIDTIEFYFRNKGSHLYASVAAIVPHVHSFLEKLFPGRKIAVTGNFKRQLEIINELEFVMEATEAEIESNIAGSEGFTLRERRDNSLVYDTGIGVDVKIFPATVSQFYETLVRTSSSEVFLNNLQDVLAGAASPAVSEEMYFKEAGLPFVPAFLREDAAMADACRNNKVPAVLQPADIKGIIHSHSNWSDGSNTIEEMAVAARDSGHEYLVISDHSKSAFYANGLSAERIREQHVYIDELNKKLAPFKIFKSIEADILNDGSLDYTDDILSRFDLVIASVHSNLKMTEEKAMMRLMKAIENPYTTILGHMTGRLLLSRPGYPVNHTSIIDACAANKVVIELNANPSRLDIDWRHIAYALEKNVLISIDPDAHSIDGMDDTLFGVLVAQKARVTALNNLSSFSFEAFEAFLHDRKRLKNI